MATPTPNLNRLLRRWSRRVAVARTAEAFLCLALGALAQTAAAFAVAAVGQWPQSHAWVCSFAAAAGIALIVAAALGLLWRRWPAFAGRVFRTPLGEFWQFAVPFLIGWAFCGVNLPAAAGSDPVLRPGPIAIANAVVLPVLACLLYAARGGRRGQTLPAWLDGRSGSNLLLATAAELGRAGRGPTPVEQAVVARAEALAAEPGRFAGVSARRLDGRWWTLLPLMLAAVALVGWVARQAESIGPGGGIAAGPPAEATVQNAAERLHAEFVLLNGPQGDPALAAQLRETAQRVSEAPNSAAAAAAMNRSKEELAGKVAAAAPVIQALAALANEPAGQPLTAVMADPSIATRQAVAAAQSQVNAWRERGLSAAERLQLAGQLRQAANQVRSSNAELADRLTRAADALAGGDWEAVLEQLGAIVRQIQPIVRGHRLNEAALRAIGQALASLAPQPPNPPSLAQPPAPAGQADVAAPADPRWQAAQEAARGNPAIQNLPADQQRLVRRYFALPD